MNKEKLPPMITIRIMNNIYISYIPDFNTEKVIDKKFKNELEEMDSEEMDRLADTIENEIKPHALMVLWLKDKEVQTIVRGGMLHEADVKMEAYEQIKLMRA